MHRTAAGKNNQAVGMETLDGSSRRHQSKNGPGSVVRSGAMSECPRTASIGYTVSSAEIIVFSVAYCMLENTSKSVPSTSIPIEKSLHAGRPLKFETPACHARSLKETN